MPRLARVAQHKPPVEFRQVAAQRLAPFAAGLQVNRGDAAVRRWVVVLRAGGNANDDGLYVAADVDPIFPAGCPPWIWRTQTTV